MSLVEIVNKIRQQQKSTEIRTSKKEAEVERVRTEAQEKARAANLEAFNQFEQGLSLRKSLQALAEAEGLKDASVYEWVKEPTASVVELRLEWSGQPEREILEGVIPTRRKGFFRIAIGWMIDGSVLVSGEKEFGIFHTSILDHESNRVKLEKSVAEAYLKPQWHEVFDQIMFQGQVGHAL